MTERALAGTASIIDAHTHLFPPSVIDGRERYLKSDSWFSELYGHPKAVMVSPDQLIESMDEAGIDRSVVCGWPWRDSGLCREHNAYLADISHGSAGRIEWLGVVVPASTDAPREARACFERGAVGLGELNADAQGFAWDEPEGLAAIVDVCLAAKRPVLAHCSEPVGHRYPGKGFGTPDRLLPFFEWFPSLTVIAAHWGGGLPFYELMPEVRAVTQNVAYDSAATTYLYDHAIFSHAVSLVGQERVVFGSDYPILRQDRLTRRVARQIEDDGTLDMIYAANADRIYGLREGQS